ncbi:MAG: FHA domain-containing protein FhaB/FipA [Terriglobales bacterium]
MPDAIVLAVARFGFLILLWVFVFAVVGVIRRDVFGARQSSVVAAPHGVKFPTSTKPQKGKRGKTPRHLVILEGALAGTRIPLKESTITFGRAEDSTVVLTDDYASTRHAHLAPRGGQWLLEDLGSTNGTYLDGTKVTGPTPVSIGAPIRIGRTVFELRS